MNVARHPATAPQRAEEVARASYGRLLALLAARTRDIAAAEDALADAFHQALRTWPVRGIPDRPEAWLLTVARRVAGHAARHGAVHDAAVPALALLIDEAAAGSGGFPDERLKLLFVCAHPAIDEAARTPLMLQTVLGLDAARVAGAFVTSPAAMAQRLVRAKTKIRAAGIRFDEPGLDELDDRLAAVLAAIYAAYGAGWDDSLGTGRLSTGLAVEALFLGRLVVELLPGQPEAHGLLALMLHCEARRPARRTPAGAFVPLDEQDVTLWSGALAQAAERHLGIAARAARPGRFQIEAAIQSVHAQRARTGVTDQRALAGLYDLLATLAPSLGGLVSRAAAHGGAFGPAAGIACLDALEPALLVAYQPYWAVRAHLLHRSGHADAAGALQRAIGLADDPAIRAHLATRYGAQTDGTVLA